MKAWGGLVVLLMACAPADPEAGRSARVSGGIEGGVALWSASDGGGRRAALRLADAECRKAGRRAESAGTPVDLRTAFGDERRLDFVCRP